MYAVNRQDAAQTQIVQILPGIARKSDNYYVLRLADAAWAGTAGARLDMNLREEKGYSYGVFSFPQFYSKSGYWAASGGVQTNKTKESIAEFMTELKNFGGEKPITQSELGLCSERSRPRLCPTIRVSGGVSRGKWRNFGQMNCPFRNCSTKRMRWPRFRSTRLMRSPRNMRRPSGATLLLVGDMTKIQAARERTRFGECCHPRRRR